MCGVQCIFYISKPEQNFKHFFEDGPTHWVLAGMVGHGSGVYSLTPVTSVINSSACVIGPPTPALTHSYSSSYTWVGSLLPLSQFPGGHHFPFPLHCRQWAMWRSGSSAHYRPGWANRGHGTVQHGSVFTAGCQDCLTLNWEGCRFSLNKDVLGEKKQPGKDK